MERDQIRRSDRLKYVLDYWRCRKPFENEDSIPDIPIVDSDSYANVIIPNIIRCGGIPKESLKVGEIYLGSCRNSSEARWNGTEFEIKRYKFGGWWDDTVKHFEDGANTEEDVFVPIKIKEDDKK